MIVDARMPELVDISFKRWSVNLYPPKKLLFLAHVLLDHMRGHGYSPIHQPI